MADIGEHAHAYFREILVKQHSYWFQSVRSILGMAHEFGNDAVNLSLKRALYYKALDIGTIRTVVKDKLYQLDTAPQLYRPPDNDGQPENPVPAPDHRDLSYYQQLLNL